MSSPSTLSIPVVLVCLMTTGVARAQSAHIPDSNLTTRSIKAVGYEVGRETTVDLKSSGLIPGAAGEAKVEARSSITMVEAKVKGLSLPTPIGTEFLSYVVWAVSPEGRAINLGEVRPDNDGNGKLKATTQLQSFSLFVTAEPYAGVRQPSEMLILENEIRKNTRGRLFIVNDYKLMKRNQYEKRDNPLALSLDLNNVPIEMYQARNAVEIAKSHDASQYAPEVLSKAQGGLELAEDALARKLDKKHIVSLALQATQFSEDARALTAERKEQERIAKERAAAAAQAKQQAEATAAAEAAAAKQRADAEAGRQAELAAAREAQLKAEAEARQAAAAAKEAQLRVEAAEKEAAAREARTLAEGAAAREQQAHVEAERARRAADDLRAQLLERFNRVLETKETARGLVITMADVLFDTGKYELRPNTREALARLSGIIATHPGLTLQIEGHTDSIGTDEFNQVLSEQRALAVRDYLAQQGVPPASITAKGLGKSMPVADNSTAEGRQKNRRVELIVSGEVIGIAISD